MKKLLKKIEKIMVAIAFAEANEHKTALEILKEEKRMTKKYMLRPVAHCSHGCSI